MIQYTAAPAIAPSAQRTPTGSIEAPDTRSRTRTNPAAATTAPKNVMTVGTCPCRNHIQPITTIGEVNSINKATPTGMYPTALKNAS